MKYGANSNLAISYVHVYNIVMSFTLKQRIKALAALYAKLVEECLVMPLLCPYNFKVSIIMTMKLERHAQ